MIKYDFINSSSDGLKIEPAHTIILISVEFEEVVRKMSE